jgi:hypothetical protein
MKQAFRRALIGLALASALIALPAAADSFHQVALTPGGANFKISLIPLWGTHTSSVVQAPGFGTWNNSTSFYTPTSDFWEAGIDRFTVADTTTGERLTVVLVANEELDKLSREETFSAGGGTGLGEHWLDEDGDGPGEVTIAGGVAEIYGEGGISNIIILEPNDPDVGQPRRIGAGGGTTGIPPFGGGPIFNDVNRSKFIDIVELAQVEAQEGIGGVHQIRAVFYGDATGCALSACATPWRTIDREDQDLDIELTVTQDVLHDIEGGEMEIGSYPNLTMRMKVKDTSNNTVLYFDEYFDIPGELPGSESATRVGILDPVPEFAQAITLDDVRHFVWVSRLHIFNVTNFEDLQSGAATSPWEDETSVAVTNSGGEWNGRTTLGTMSGTGSRIYTAATSGTTPTKKKARIAFDLDFSNAHLVDNESMLVAAGIGHTTNDLDTQNSFQILTQRLSGDSRIWARTFDSGGATAYKTTAYYYSPETPLRVVLRWQAPGTDAAVLKMWINGNKVDWHSSVPTTVYKLLKGVAFGPSTLSLISGTQPPPSSGPKVVAVDRLTYVVETDPPPVEE